MLKKEMEQHQAIEMLCTDMLVPKDHLLRKIDAAVDFTYIYDLVEDLRNIFIPLSFVFPRFLILYIFDMKMLFLAGL
ncbi:MAG: hypothetical protein IKC28_09710 [Clostridia bacterium]|nr:hypothetical protein [Clostridia bacterium]